MGSLMKLIDFIFKYATYVMLCLMVGFVVGYVLAGPYVFDLILSWVA